MTVLTNKCRKKRILKLYKALFVMSDGDIIPITHNLKTANQLVQNIYDILANKNSYGPTPFMFFKSVDGTSCFFDVTKVVGAYLVEDDSEHIKQIQELEKIGLQRLKDMDERDNEGESWKIDDDEET